MTASPEDKLRGGYYTPVLLAEWMSRWAAPLGTEKILEPSCGDGNFLVALRSAGSNVQLTAIEFNADEAEKARNRGTQASVINEDFFKWIRHNRDNVVGRFDAVVGNPPFIRYQNFPESHRAFAFGLMQEEGLKPSRLTNAWLPFVVGATMALREGGRLALVLPAELLQVSYASQLRAYLARKFVNLHLVSFKSLVFPGILQEVVLLLGVRKDCEAATISTIEVDNAADLLGVVPERTAGAMALSSSEKWTKYYLRPIEIQLLRECQNLPGVKRLGDLASVDVGIVTGRNQFFVTSASLASASGVTSSTQPMIGRSAHVPGLRLAVSDWEKLREEDARVLLFNPGRIDRSMLTAEDREYVEAGEAQGAAAGYKCRIRQPTWWAVPSTWVPDAFLLRQIYDGPRMISNEAQVTCTDTIHRVSVLSGTSAAQLCASFANSLTWAFSEVRGRSYGGGVLELEPTEAESLPVPTIGAAALDLEKLDSLQRSQGSRALLDEVDRQILAGTGLDANDRARLRVIWEKLSNRRSARKMAKH